MLQCYIFKASNAAMQLGCVCCDSAFPPKMQACAHFQAQKGSLHLPLAATHLPSPAPTHLDTLTHIHTRTIEVQHAPAVTQDCHHGILPPPPTIHSHARATELQHAPAVTHDRHRGILARPELVIIDELDGFGGEQGALGVAQQVQQGVHAVQLVVGDVAHGLFAHGTLQGSDKEARQLFLSVN
eukprot:1160442-Pelagomonas_calceolata.AAC.9